MEVSSIKVGERRNPRNFGPRINRRIRAREVRLIGEDGVQIGVVSLEEALRQAQEASLDLVEVAPQANPPVCKIMDYGKYKYEQEKKQKEAKKKQRHFQLKSIRLTPKIEKHDLQTKVSKMRDFLEKGFKVKVMMWFRGREMAHVDIGKGIMEKIIEMLEDVASPERKPKMEGRNCVMVLMPKNIGKR